MKKVDSTHLDMIHYDPTQKTLHVTFKNGKTYQYSGVDQGTYNNLENADSVGQHFIQNIKTKYPFKKVT